MKYMKLLCAALAATVLCSGRPADEVMTRDNGTYIVNTTTLANDVNGYVENTPLKIYIKGDKIQRIEPLPNQETPKYFYRVKKDVLNKWDGKKVKAVRRLMRTTLFRNSLLQAAISFTSSQKPKMKNLIND